MFEEAFSAIAMSGMRKPCGFMIKTLSPDVRLKFGEAEKCAGRGESSLLDGGVGKFA